MKASHARLVGGAAFFAVAVAAFTTVGLLATAARERGWIEVANGGAMSASVGPAAPASMALLATWQGAAGDPPPGVAALDGTAVELVGHASPLSGQAGLLLVADVISTQLGRDTPPERAVWIELPAGTRSVAVAGRGRRIRAQGVLRVGRTDLPGEGEARQTVAYRLELGTLEVRSAFQMAP